MANDIANNLVETIQQLEKELAELKAADVQPVKRGYWIAENRDSRGYADCYTCSHCESYVYTYTLMKDCEFDYCPNCGADMRGDDNELSDTEKS